MFKHYLLGSDTEFNAKSKRLQSKSNINFKNLSNFYIEKDRTNPLHLLLLSLFYFHGPSMKETQLKRKLGQILPRVRVKLRRMLKKKKRMCIFIIKFLSSRGKVLICSLKTKDIFPI